MEMMDFHSFLVYRGYEYSNAIQPIHIEIWTEKTTMKDKLLPLCKRLFNSVRARRWVYKYYGIGRLLKTVQKVNKPTIILYISDFDPAGKNMPVQVAREIEFFMLQQTYFSINNAETNYIDSWAD